MSILNFNAQTVAPTSAFDPLPPGWYHVKIVESETKPVNPPKKGSYLALTLEVIEGTYAGRKIFLNLNLENENPVAVKIAYEQLSAICYVTGQIQCERSEQLHGIPFQAKLAVREAEGNYDASNTVKGFRDQHGREPKELAGGATTSAPAAGAPAAPPPPPAPPAAPAALPAAHDPFAAAVADGWIKHPTSAGYYYKGQDVKADADVAAMYPAPAAPPAPPAAPAAPAAPQAPQAPQAPAAPAAPAANGDAVPPWAKPSA